MQGWGRVLQKTAYSLNQHQIYVIVSSIARIHGSMNQGVDIEVTPLTTTPSDLVVTFLIPVPTTLYSAGLEVLVPEEEMLSPRDPILMSLNWKLRSSPNHFGLLISLSQ